MACFVYAFGVDGDVPGLDAVLKIGVANNPAHRLASCQTGSPVKLAIRKTWKFEESDDAFSFEAACHKEFEDRNVHLEWFKVCVADVDHLRERFYTSDDAAFEIAEVRRALERQAKIDEGTRAAAAKVPEPKPIPRKPVSDADLLNNAEAAHFISRSPSWLNKSRMTGTGPVYLKIGGGVRYRVSDLKVWLESMRRNAVYDFNNTVAA